MNISPSTESPLPLEVGENFQPGISPPLKIGESFQRGVSPPLKAGESFLRGVSPPLKGRGWGWGL